jgi:hypothetical protein
VAGPACRGSADKPDAERIAAAPNDFAAAPRRPRHESDVELPSNFHGSVEGYLRAALRNIGDFAFAIGRAVLQRDPSRLMAAPANLLALHLELRPCLLVHADTLTVKRLSFIHRDASFCTCRMASAPGRRSPPDLISDQFDSTGAMRSAIRNSP